MRHISFQFQSLTTDPAGVLILPVGDAASLQGKAGQLDGETKGAIAKAAGIAEFKAKRGEVLDLIGGSGTGLDRLILIGSVKKENDAEATHALMLGGEIGGVLNGLKTVEKISVLAEGMNAEAAAQLAMGIKLRLYDFDRYKSKKKDGELNDNKGLKVLLHVENPAAAKKAWSEAEAIADGVCLARDLVNLPPNDLGPIEFAEKAKQLEALGVEVEVLDEKKMARLGMRALLAVGQGSAENRQSRLAIMKWNGSAKKKNEPIAFVGKGVVFDTGGISIKPSSGMEDMKGDMGGAACVTGLMHALAARKARVNAIGVIGLVENMPDGNAQRPGDILTAMNGTTIEVINTDAEGRLVLADALHYTIDRFKPSAIINLATLTGAIIVALGNDHAGLFSNNDNLASEITAAGLETGDKVWRLPMGPAYEKLIESKFADIKNSGGRMAGSITAAQFLQHFVGETPWAHLDVAGTAMDSPKSPISQGWASGFGVRLLNEFVRARFEG